MGVAPRLYDGQARRIVALLAREAGKTLPDGVAEVREAADFCRYYAHLAREPVRRRRSPRPARPARATPWHLRGRGVFVCIIPWNFPLAIFTGQIAAALAAGNAVLAKPAEQTPLIAAEAVRPVSSPPACRRDVLALLPGDGERVGAASDRAIRARGRCLHRRHRDRLGHQPAAWRRATAPIVPLIAETGGLNAMFVDTTALREQVIDDVIVSAFGCAGQRCSALRLLFVQARSPTALIEGLRRRDGRPGARRSGRPGHRHRPGDRRSGAGRWRRTRRRSSARRQGLHRVR